MIFLKIFLISFVFLAIGGICSALFQDDWNNYYNDGIYSEFYPDFPIHYAIFAFMTIISILVIIVDFIIMVILA